MPPTPGIWSLSCWTTREILPIVFFFVLVTLFSNFYHCSHLEYTHTHTHTHKWECCCCKFRTNYSKHLTLTFLLNWASLVAQMVKNLPVMQETQVQSLGQEDPLEKGMAGYPLRYSRLENSMDREAWWVYGVTESDMTKHPTLALFSFELIKWNKVITLSSRWSNPRIFYIHLVPEWRLENIPSGIMGSWNVMEQRALQTTWIRPWSTQPLFWNSQISLTSVNYFQ